jgi:hypothetical protein
MRRRSSRTVWLAKVSFIDRSPGQLAMVHRRFPESVRAALNPERPVRFYGREWRLSQPIWNSDGETVLAQLGFRRRTQHEEVDYDESRHEWVSSEAAARQGNFSNFVLDLKRQLIAFEDRGDDLKREAFLNAFSLFLRPAGLEINLISDTRGFETWLDSVDSVTRFRVTLRRPNPGYSKRAALVRDLAQETAADRLTVEAESKDGLNVRNTLLDGAADTAAMGNGSFKATGIVAGKHRFFDSAKRFLSTRITVDPSDSMDTIVSKIEDAMNDVAPDALKDDEAPHE